MRTIAMSVLLLAVLTLAAQGLMPANLSVDFDPPNGIVRGDPSLYTTFEAYIVAKHVNGLQRIALTAYVSQGAAIVTAVDISCFHPEAVTIAGGFGDTENGWIIEAPECVQPDEDGLIILARIEMICMGIAGEVVIEPHPTEGKSSYRCDDPYGEFPYAICGYGGVHMDPLPGDPDCGYAITWVFCEEQVGSNPQHPPTYWYAASVGPGSCCYGFHVQVYDPDFENYTNWVDPPMWVHADSIIHVGEELWVSWWTEDAWFHGERRFGFDNSNPSAWGSWTMTEGLGPDPYADVYSSDAEFPDELDGLGRRVHVPSASASPVESGSWGTIKALYK